MMGGKTTFPFGKVPFQGRTVKLQVSPKFMHQRLLSKLGFPQGLPALDNGQMAFAVAALVRTHNMRCTLNLYTPPRMVTVAFLTVKIPGFPTFPYIKIE